MEDKPFIPKICRECPTGQHRHDEGRNCQCEKKAAEIQRLEQLISEEESS